MLVVGVTGRSGSGKSSVTEHFRALGYPAVDGDLVSREVAQPGSAVLRALAAAFGADIIGEDGALLRRELAQRAFATPQGTKTLVDITHPPIVAELLRGAEQARGSGAPLYFVDGAVIVGAAFETYCDKIVVVTSEQRLSLSRVMLRDGISKTAAQSRLGAQLPQETLLAAANYVIHNDGDLATLHKRADEVLEKLLHDAKARQ